MAPASVQTHTLDAPNDGKLGITFYDDGSIRLRLKGMAPVCVTEAHLSGNVLGGEALIKIERRSTIVNPPEATVAEQRATAERLASNGDELCEELQFAEGRGVDRDQIEDMIQRGMKLLSGIRALRRHSNDAHVEEVLEDASVKIEHAMIGEV